MSDTSTMSFVQITRVKIQALNRELSEEFLSIWETKKPPKEVKVRVRDSIPVIGTDPKSGISKYADILQNLCDCVIRLTGVIASK